MRIACSTPAEIEVRRLFTGRADLYAQKIMQLPLVAQPSWAGTVASQINRLKAATQMRDIVALERSGANCRMTRIRRHVGRRRCFRPLNGPAAHPSCRGFPGDTEENGEIFSASIFWR